MSAERDYLEAHLRTLEEISAKVEALKVELVSRYQPNCPGQYTGELQDLIGTIDDARSDFIGSAIRDCRDKLADLDEADAIAERIHQRRDYFASVV